MEKNTLHTALKQLYTTADQLSAKLTQLHGSRLQCRQGCSACCVDELTVFSLEAAYIQQEHAALIAKASPHAAGACAFLDAAGGCRIYANRPLVCRTQGLPLSWQLEKEDASAAELRDICPLNEAGEPLEHLPTTALFPVSPFEERLALLQLHYDGGSLERVALRGLFKKA